MRLSISPEIEETLKKIRAAFPRTSYIGGSYARHLCLGSDYKYDDIDIFILGPRKQEMWIVELLLKQVFDTAVCDTRDSGYYHLIDNQFARVVCMKDGIKYDLIFVDTDIDNLISKNTASSLSMFYYEITYDECEMLHLVKCKESRAAFALIEFDNICVINKRISTESHINKIEKLCREHNLELRQPPGIPITQYENIFKT